MLRQAVTHDCHMFGTAPMPGEVNFIRRANINGCILQPQTRVNIAIVANIVT